MLVLAERIRDLATVAKDFFDPEAPATQAVWREAEYMNPWFTKEMLEFQFSCWQKLMLVSSLEKWVAPYPAEPVAAKKIGLILAGNLPLVGFHDVLSVLISGHSAIVKPSSEDKVLIKAFAQQLWDKNPEWKNRLSFTDDRLGEVDAVIATGSNNTNRYFEYYFRDKPSILRGNRNSVAVLTGLESEEQLVALGRDVMLFFGRGCRSVSKLMLPKGYDIPHMLDQWRSWEYMINHNKFANNYMYHRALMLMNLEPHLDTGYLVLKEDSKLAAPVGVLFYEFYDNADDLKHKLREQESQLQCVVADFAIEGIPVVPLGKAQNPELTDYADAANTLAFLSKL